MSDPIHRREGDGEDVGLRTGAEPERSNAGQAKSSVSSSMYGKLMMRLFARIASCGSRWGKKTSWLRISPGVESGSGYSYSGKRSDQLFPAYRPATRSSALNAETQRGSVSA